MMTLRSIVTLLLIGAGIAVYVPAVIVCALAPYRVRWAVARSWARYSLWLMKVLCGLDYTVEGAEHLDGLPPSVVFCKHQSQWETIATIAIFPAHTWVLKRELMWMPILGWGLAAMRPIAVDRSGGRRAVRQVVEQGKRGLGAGRWVMVFPEGTRLPPLTTRKYGIGGGVLAIDAGVQVIPVAHNAGSFWPRRRLITRGGTVRVIIGPPIPSQGKTLDQLNHEAQTWIESHMARIEPPPEA
jgi:1-acyl-sn-glycerol-3-phosphate acyltransferase